MPTLGKDCVITGVNNDAVRNVSWSESARSIDHQPFGSYENYALNVGFSRTVEVELIEDPSLDTYSTITLGGYLAGTYIVTDVAVTEPLDDVVTYRITLKMTRA